MRFICYSSHGPLFGQSLKEVALRKARQNYEEDGKRLECVWFVESRAVILELVVFLSKYLRGHVGSVVANCLLADCTLRFHVINDTVISRIFLYSPFIYSFLWHLFFIIFKIN